MTGPADKASAGAGPADAIPWTAIERHLRQAPDARRVVHKGRAFSGREVHAAALNAAAWLQTQGVSPGDWVGVALTDEWDHLVTLLALLRLGCPQAVLASFEGPDAHRDTATRLQLKHVVCADAAVVPPPARAIVWGPPAHGPDIIDLDAPLPSPDTMAFVQASSGSTGRPKLIPVTNGQWLQSCLHYAFKTPCVLLPTTIEHNIARRWHLRQITLGDTSVLASCVSGDLLEDCRRYGVEALYLSAYQGRNLVAAERAREQTERGREQAERAREPVPSTARVSLPHMRVMLAGSKIERELLLDVQRCTGGRAMIVYGTTECGGIASATPTDLEHAPDTVGRVAAHVEVQVVGEDDQPLPAGQFGRARIRTHGMATHYIDDEAATARGWRDGWFYPGDVLMQQEDGLLIIAGRADDMMILNSINIFPAEIERVAAALPGVAECAAFAVRSALHGDIPMLAVVAEPGATLDMAELQKVCRARLGHRAPRKLHLVDELPRAPGGKVLRRELARLFG